MHIYVSFSVTLVIKLPTVFSLVIVIALAAHVSCQQPNGKSDLTELLPVTLKACGGHMLQR